MQKPPLYIYDAIPAAEETPLEDLDCIRRSAADDNLLLETAITTRNRKHSIAAVLLACAIVVAAISLAASTSSTSTTSTRSHVVGFDTSLLGAQELVVSRPKGSSLSSRGQSIKMARDDLAMFAAGAADAYHPTQNMDGYLVMLVAENKLMWKEMADKLEEVRMQSDRPLPQWIFNYGDMGGQTDFKDVMSKVMQKWIHPQVDPNKLRFQAGAGSVLDCLSWCLADEDDGVLVTGPNYPAFVSDFNMRGHVKLHVAPTQATNGYAPTVQELDECWERSLEAGNPPKILIICQPNNPTGIIYSEAAMHLMISWALEKGLHVVSDEIYALSVFPGQETTSAAQIMSQYINPGNESGDYLGDRVHIVAGMSKDWGMSGFRVGSLFTHNEKLLQAVNTLGYYQSVSEYTQYALTRVFQDDVWVDWYIAENQKRLEATFDALQDALDLIGVPLFPSKGALFAWADFSSLLKPGQSEKQLWLELFKDAKVAFTTGESCNGEKPGLFRVVYPWPEGGVDAMKELGQRLVTWKAQR